MADPAIAERAARAYLTAHLDELAPGARVEDFVVVANQVDRGVRTVGFRQTAYGLRVVGGQLYVVFAHDRLFAAASQALPHVTAALPPGRASFDRVAAWMTEPVTLRSTGERVVLPVSSSYRVADVVEATSGPRRWEVFVAPDGTPLARIARHADATATLRFDVPVRRPTSTRTLAPAPRLEITVNGVATTTSATGAFSWTGAAPASVVTSVAGPLVEVITAVGAPATATLTALPGSATDWSVATVEQADAQLTAFVYAMVAKTRARAMHPTLAWLDQTMAVHVNEAGSCNALSDGDALHLFGSSAECENTARLADVILHEFAHSLHAQSVIPGAGEFDAAVSEGIADFYAANITGDPGVARGLFYDNTPLRDIAPAIPLRFPTDVSPDPHLTGLIVAGALWDLRTTLIAQLGEPLGIASVEQIYIGILQRGGDLTTTYTAALVADDDDGDLDNGTPHGCAIELAFARHGLVAGFVTTAIAAPVAAGHHIAVAVTTPLTACPRPTVTAMTLTYVLPGALPATLAMQPSGAIWSADLPPQPDGTVVRYQVAVELDDGTHLAFPDNPADPMYQLFLGNATPLYCERFDGDPRWLQGGAMGWEVAPPFGRAGDPDVTFTGVRMLGTNLSGSGLYPANTSTSITMPAIATTGFTAVHLQFRRWLVSNASDRAAIEVAGTAVWQSSADLDHVDREWRFVDVELPPGEIAATWSITADATGERGGWNLDDVCIVGIGKLATCGDGVVDATEECDGGDDCNADCTVAGGGCCSTGGDPGAALVLAFLAGYRKVRRSRVSSARCPR